MCLWQVLPHRDKFTEAHIWLLLQVSFLLRFSMGPEMREQSVQASCQ